MKRRHKNKHDLLPFIGATLCFSAAILLSQAGPARANTLGTLSIPSANLSNDDQSDLSAATLGSASARHDVVANRTVKLQAGDTLESVLAREGIPADQRDDALKALSDLYDISKLKAGDEIEFSMRASVGDTTGARLVALHLRTEHNQVLTVVAGADGAFHRRTQPVVRNDNVSIGVTARSGILKRDLMSDLVAADIPQTVAEDVAAAFTYDPEIPTNPSSGSKFTVVYETARSKSGAAHIMRYAELSIHGQQHRVYRYETNDGTVAFMEESGRGVAPFQLGAPIHDAKMTSPWGWRVHPVLKVRKFHKGIDFAAPKGTPIYAAEDGVIETIGWRGNYGRFLKIVHNERVATTYGHMSGFAKGLHEGSKVKKGQVVAYVGRSGMSTGNHLYYEVLVDNKQVDPSRSDIMLQVNLDGSSLVRFRTYVAQMSQAAAQP
ncbi:MAG: M23 family metallopeptidase [Parvibaculum sp.]|jgi:murein DD-endopeptidase MepM/ murein hydrolase activator NlpD|uniref:M23 family metallopeptidase n=1 Tax=Parvibaculum sp. TaxID=2024848 RepID=UPI0025EA84FD|nr:M23 family metallopeptidase [Parvibaculum sp.]MCE9649254.1 M23 family metallopeptidase [Parvibaculum sp.]